MPLEPVNRRTALKWVSLGAAGAGLLGRTTRARAEAPRVTPAGQFPKDRRLEELKSLDSYFPFSPSATPEEWIKRAEYVRRQVLVACGLWPMPPRPPIEATIHGRVDRDEYTVEKVYFESHPGLYVTGSLYRPKGATGKRPGILCPHGHWANGRYHDHGEAKVKQEIELKAEQFPIGGRHPLQARCVQLARMGCVVFLYDMLGYADNNVISSGVIHGFAKQRPEMSQPERWGLFSAQSELRCLNAVGLQTWNSIRALDWLETLPDVDPERIGVTGASGGGTQTFLLGCVDPRPAAFFPAVMVSTAMQGGCTCENASYLRVGTGNIEFAAMVAPRPLAMSAANDWTRELETKGLPELKQHYALLGAPDRVSGKYFPFEHNYNQPSRLMMYQFFQQALGIGGGEIVERDYVPLTREEISVWDAAHPAPTGGDEGELKVLRAFDSDFRRQLEEYEPKDTATLGEFRRVIGGGWDILIGRNLSSAGDVETENATETQRSGYREFAGWVRNRTHGEEVPALFFLPDAWQGQLVIWLTDSGKGGLLDASGAPRPALQKLIAKGIAVAGLDLFGQGEFTADGKPFSETRRVKNPREFLGYTVGYNHPLFSQRVHDVLSFIAAARRHQTPPAAIHLAGFGSAGLFAAAAAVQAGDAVKKLAVGTNGYRFGSITEVRDPLLLPGAVRYGDVPALLALSAPRPLWLSGEGAAPPKTVAEAYASAGRPNRVATHTETGDAAELAAAEWLAS